MQACTREQSGHRPRLQPILLCYFVQLSLRCNCSICTGVNHDEFSYSCLCSICSTIPPAAQYLAAATAALDQWHIEPGFATGMTGLATCAAVEASAGCLILAKAGQTAATPSLLVEPSPFRPSECRGLRQRCMRAQPCMQQWPR
jgi:hypothetical protein